MKGLGSLGSLGGINLGSLGGTNINLGSIGSSIKSVVAPSDIVSKAASCKDTIKDKASNFLSNIKGNTDSESSGMLSKISSYKSEVLEKVGDFKNTEGVSKIIDKFGDIKDAEGMYQDYMGDSSNQLDEMLNGFDMSSAINVDEIKNLLPMS